MDGRQLTKWEHKLKHHINLKYNNKLDFCTFILIQQTAKSAQVHWQS